MLGIVGILSVVFAEVFGLHFVSYFGTVLFAFPSACSQEIKWTRISFFI